MPNYYHQKRAEFLLEHPLEYPILPARASGRVLFRIWTEPAFGPYGSWTLIQNEQEYYLRRIIWDQLTAVVSPEPVTYGAEVAVEESFFKAFAVALQEMRLPATIPNTMGLDGEFNGIEFFEGESSVKLRWWCEPPDPWKELGLWHKSAIRALDAKLPPTTVSYRGVEWPSGRW